MVNVDIFFGGKREVAYLTNIAPARRDEFDVHVGLSLQLQNDRVVVPINRHTAAEHRYLSRPILRACERQRQNRKQNDQHAKRLQSQISSHFSFSYRLSNLRRACMQLSSVFLLPWAHSLLDPNSIPCTK